MMSPTGFDEGAKFGGMSWVTVCWMTDPSPCRPCVSSSLAAGCHRVQALGKAKDGYNATRKTESEKKAELKVIQDKIKLAHARLEGLNKVKEEEGEGVNALYEEKKSLHEEVRVEG